MLPDVGDIAWVELGLVQGTEQAGRRPALVLSSADYHKRSPRALICPITSNVGNWPFNVRLPAGLKTQGAVLVDQIRAVDRAGRLFGMIERVPNELLADVRGRLAALLGFELPDFTAS